MAAFISFEGEKERFRKIPATTIRAETQKTPFLIFGFPEIERTPEKSVRLYLFYPKPEDERTSNEYFSRQCLRLWNPKDFFLPA